MAHNKFITKNGQTLLDLTNDTVTADKLPIGITAHNRSGELIEGTMDTEAATEAAVEAAVNAYEAELDEIVGGDEDETVKSNLIALRSTANSTTGESDATLTEAVVTLMDGYGTALSGSLEIIENGTFDVADKASVNVNVPSEEPTLEEITITENGEYTPSRDGFSKVTVNVAAAEGGGGECSGNHIIEVDQLPEVGVEGAYYGVRGFNDVVRVAQGEVSSMADSGMEVNGIIATSETLSTIEPEYNTLCYVTDIPELYMYIDSWTPLSQYFGGECLGKITNISEADTSAEGYYAVFGIVDLYKCVNGQFKKLILQGGLVFTSNGDGTCYVGGLTDNHDIDIVIPSISPTGETVTSIGHEDMGMSRVFDEKLFKSVTIPDTVTYIYQFAFENCDGLRGITIPDSVTSIGYHAFYGCRALSEITFGNGLTSIGDYAFMGCSSLYNITIPNGVTKIDNFTFFACSSLKTITLSSTLTEIKFQAFGGCSALNSIAFNGTMEQWQAITKEDYWNENVPATKVICSDGEVILREEVTDSPLPIEVSTEAEMNALLETAEVGAIYKYTGETTDTYENGAWYAVEEESGNKVYTKLVNEIPSYDGTITVV